MKRTFCFLVRQCPQLFDHIPACWQPIRALLSTSTYVFYGPWRTVSNADSDKDRDAGRSGPLPRLNSRDLACPSLCTLKAFESSSTRQHRHVEPGSLEEVMSVVTTFSKAGCQNVVRGSAATQGHSHLVAKHRSCLCWAQGLCLLSSFPAAQ